MTMFRSLPDRPSWESIRKQAKQLGREASAGDAEALRRVRTTVPNLSLPLSQRDAQLVLAREYGFSGWQELKAEVLRRDGKGLEWAAVQARRAIHDNDVERLRQLVAEFPLLLSWRDDLGNCLLDATTSFANDSADEERERAHNRPECADFLIDAGAEGVASVRQRVIRTGAGGMLRLLSAKGVLPLSLPTLAALGDLDGVRTQLDSTRTTHTARNTDDERALVVEAFLHACRFEQTTVASLLLDRCVEFDDQLGNRIDRWRDRTSFVEFLCTHMREWDGMDSHATPWRVFVVLQLMKAVDDDDADAADQWLRSDASLLDESCVDIQAQLLERAAWSGREEFITRLLALRPAVLSRRPPPPSSAIVSALEYGNAHLVPLLTRIWPAVDDLPHAAGMGDLPRVRRWFDEAGRPMLGNPHDHYPGNSPRTRVNLGWSSSTTQRVLDVALAWACMNREFEVASFLLERGADINTRWSTHEPASILHECALHGNHEGARFLVEHGIDLTIRDDRYQATAAGWARHAAGDREMAEYLAAAERAGTTTGAG
jgi:hypothetical protein